MKIALLLIKDITYDKITLVRLTFRKFLRENGNRMKILFNKLCEAPFWPA